MSTDRTMLKNCLTHITATAFTALFGAVYEIFSHGVYSYFMIYAFALPLVLGALPSLILALSGKRCPGTWSVRLCNIGIAALTIGSLFQGVLQIYGTAKQTVIVYPIIGVLAIAAGIFIYIFKK